VGERIYWHLHFSLGLVPKAFLHNAVHLLKDFWSEVNFTTLIAHFCRNVFQNEDRFTPKVNVAYTFLHDHTLAKITFS
jgi:hypothetical protein